MLSEEMLWRYVEGELAPVQAGEIEELERTNESVRRRLDDIRARIESGEYGAAQRLVIDKLSKELEVSPVPPMIAN